MIYPWRRVARITLQFETAFLIGSGDERDGVDRTFVTDHLGLPFITGSTMAGVLRAELGRRGMDEAVLVRLFGNQTKAEGQAARLWISDARIHDQRNPVEGWPAPLSLTENENPHLHYARTPEPERSHVKLDAGGTADEHMLFNEHLVPAGHRFTFELVLWDVATGEAESLHDAWRTLLALVRSGEVRIGSGSRRGLGRAAVQRLVAGDFNLSVPEGWAVWQRHPVALAETSPVLQTPLDLPDLPALVGSVSIELKLALSSGWRIGLGKKEKEKAKVDLKARRELRVYWDGDEAHGDDCLVLPGTSLKGPLRHRALYHWLLAHGRLLDSSAASSDEEANKRIADYKRWTDEADRCLDTLFGFVRKLDGKTEAQRGRLEIDDLIVGGSAASRARTPLCRLTGVPLAPLSVEHAPANILVARWRIDTRSGPRERKQCCELDPAALAAFQAALADLAAGQLAIGGGGGFGLGFCDPAHSEIIWDGQPLSRLPFFESQT